MRRLVREQLHTPCSKLCKLDHNNQSEASRCTSIYIYYIYIHTYMLAISGREGPSIPLLKYFVPTVGVSTLISLYIKKPPYFQVPVDIFPNSQISTCHLQCRLQLLLKGGGSSTPGGNMVYIFFWNRLGIERVENGRMPLQ